MPELSQKIRFLTMKSMFVLCILLLNVYNSIQMQTNLNPALCGPNQEWTSTGINCNTCENTRCVRCALIKQPGCFCDSDSIRPNLNTFDCIKRVDCPVCVPAKNRDCSCHQNIQK